MVKDIFEYRQEAISEVEKFIDTAGLESYELSEGFRENAKESGDFGFELGTWRDFIYKKDDAAAIDKVKEALFKIINTTAAIKRRKEEEKKNQEKNKDDKKKKDDTDYWKEYHKENADYWQKSAQWWRDYNSKKYDWQKDDKKRDEENKKQFDKPKEDGVDKHKKEFITDIEMELTKENISDDRLSKRVGVNDWREKIRGTTDFSGALSMRSHLWDIVRKLKHEYTCANCGVKKEEFTVYEKGDKKYCSYECDKAAKDKEDNKDNDYPTPNKKKGKWSFSITDLFAAMKKAGIESVDINSTTNEIIVKYKNNTTGKLEDASLPSELKSQVKSEVQASRKPITFSEVSSEFNKEKKDNKGNGGIIAAIIIVGILFAVVIGVVVHKNKKKDY